MNKPINELNKELSMVVLETRNILEEAEMDAVLKVQSEEYYRKAESLQDMKEFNSLTQEELTEYESHIQNLQNTFVKKAEEKNKSRNPDISHTKKHQYAEEQAHGYLDLVSNFSADGNSGFYDVMVNLETKYAAGTKTLHSIVENLQAKGLDVQIAQAEKYPHEKVEGSRFGNYDTTFVVVMPSSAYRHFNDAIHEEQENSIDNVSINGFREFFLLPFLTKNPTLEDIKEAVSDFDHFSELYVENAFEEKLCLGTSRLFGNNNESYQKIINSVSEALSQTSPSMKNNSVHMINRTYKDSEENNNLGIANKSVTWEDQARIICSNEKGEDIKNLLKVKIDNLNVPNIRKINLKKPK